MTNGINNGPNSNITQINAIEGLISQVCEHLNNLDVKNSGQLQRRLEAMGVLADWQGKELHRLRKVFE